MQAVIWEKVLGDLRELGCGTWKGGAHHLLFALNLQLSLWATGLNVTEDFLGRNTLADFFLKGKGAALFIFQALLVKGSPLAGRGAVCM